jgi:CelD/BcsL family acetyltransferase involved in cellulose biosynthesis
MSGHPLSLPESWSSYIASRTKHFRKEQARIARVFERHANARFEMVTTPERAEVILAAMEKLQSERMRNLGLPYRLDEPIYTAFYRRLAHAGIPSGDVVIGALLADNDELVAGLFGITLANGATFVRIAHAGGVWRNASPGRLVIEKTIEALHARRFRSIDLSIGDYGYKNNFGVGSTPLMDVVSAISLRGWPSVLSHRTKATIHENQLGHALLILFGKA